MATSGEQARRERLRAILKKSRAASSPRQPAAPMSADSGLYVRLQNFFKKYGAAYYLIVSLVSGAFKSLAYRRAYRSVMQAYGTGHVILNLGSGPQRLDGRQDIINVDIAPFREVDLCCDVSDIPIKNGCVDLLLTISMLEHVPDPGAVVREIHRILKPGGEVFCFVPFLYPFHSSPFDYHRWTHMGLERLFGSFSHVDLHVGYGPTSALVVVFQEWFATLFSFGSKAVHDLLLIVIMLATIPIKYLDLLFPDNQASAVLASGFIVRARK